MNRAAALCSAAACFCAGAAEEPRWRRRRLCDCIGIVVGEDWMIAKSLCGAVFALSVVSIPATAQERSDLVVVTGSMIQSDDEYEEEFGALPYVSIVVPADFVLFTVALETGTSSVEERRRELERTFVGLSDRVRRTQGITMEVGYPGRSAPLETAAAREAIQYDRERSTIQVVLKFAIRPGETFSALRTRAEEFIDDIPVSGRAEAVAGDEQYIGVSDPTKHREALLRKIAEDTHLLQSIFSNGTATGLSGVSLTGLGGRVKTRPVGPLELEMFIPYYVILGEPLPQPPPRN
jgi:hypothetical protein